MKPFNPDAKCPIEQRTIEELTIERYKQDAKWGHQHYDDDRDWFLIFAEEVGELSKAVCDLRFGRARWKAARKELVQALAVGIAWLEDRP